MTTAEIKAIPATYNGVTFRSRTEARWAVFFDALGVRWEYEHEGYQLPSGWYLPDFWLPELSGGMFAEIKPRRAPTEREAQAVKELCAATGKMTCIFPGAPHEWYEDSINGDAPWACIGRGACGGCDECPDDVAHESSDAEEVIEDQYDFWVSKTEVRFAFVGAKLWRDGFVGDLGRMLRAIDASRTKRFW